MAKKPRYGATTYIPGVTDFGRVSYSKKVTPRPPPPSKPPTRADKDRTIRAAESGLLPAEVAVAPPPSPKVMVAPYRAGQAPVTKAQAKAHEDALRDARYTVALAAPVYGPARAVLAQTMPPGRRAEILRRQTAVAEAQRRKDAAEAAQRRLEAQLAAKLTTDVVPSRSDLGALGHGLAQTGVGAFHLADALTDRRTYGNAIEALGETVGPPVAKRVAGAVVSARDLIERATNIFTGTPLETRRGPRPSQEEYEIRAAAVPVPSPDDLYKASKALSKVAVGFGVSIPGMARHPEKTAEEIVGTIRGIGQAAVAIPLVMSPQHTDAERKALITGTVKGAIQSIKDAYGEDASYGDVVHAAYNDPFLYFLNGLAVAAPAARIGAMLRFWRGGATLDEAWALSRDPSRAAEFGVGHLYKPRTLTVRGKHTAPYTVEAPQSRSALMRHVERGGDIISGAIERMPLGIGPRVPFVTETSRGLRVQAREHRRVVQQLVAEGHALWAEVQGYLKENPEQAARIFYTLQRPEDIPEDVWLKGLIDDLDEMLGGRPMPGKGPSPAEQKLQRRLDKFRKSVDAATQEKWITKTKDVHDAQQQLALAIVNTNKDLREHRAYMREIEADPERDETWKAAHLKAAKLHEASLVKRRNMLVEQRDDLTVDQPDVVSDRRTELEKAMVETPKIDEHEAAAVLDVLDARARKWGRDNDRDPGEWYTDPQGLGLTQIRRIEREADLPEGSLAQRLDMPTTPLKPDPATALTNRNRAVHIRALRRGQKTWRKKNKDGSITETKVSAKPLEYANKPTTDAEGRILFGGEVPYEIVAKRWEEGFRRAFPDMSDDEIRAEMLKSSRFYKELFPLFGRIMDDREVQAWLVSQKGASPARGLLDLTKVIERALIRERIGPKDIGLAAQTMARVLYGERDISKGVAAKLTDFTDVGHMKTATRTWADDDPDAGAPYVADRWEGRAGPGLVDPSYLETVYREHDAALQAQGYISRAEWEELRRDANAKTRKWVEAKEKAGKKPTLTERNTQNAKNLRANEKAWERKRENRGRKVIKSDMGSGLTDVQYEHVSDYGNGLTQYLNETRHLGKDDWDTADTQALNWAGHQRYMGEAPENIDTALYAQEKAVAFEIEGVGRLASKFPEFAGLSREERFAITKHVADEAIDRAAERSGAIVIRTSVGYGGWEGDLAASVRVGVLAAPRAFAAFVDNLRALLDEEEVYGFHVHSQGEYRQFVVESPVMEDPEVLLDVWQQLREAHPEFMGFTQVPGGGFSSVLMTETGMPLKVTKAFQDAVTATMTRVEQQHGAVFRINVDAVDPVISSRSGSALDAQLGKHVREAKDDRAESRRRRASAASAQEALRVGRHDRDAVDARIRDGLDRLQRDGPEALELPRGRIEDPLARPSTSRITETRPLRTRALPLDAKGRSRGANIYFQLREGAQPPRTMNQVRAGDLNGAVHFLNSEDGQRILYLTERADATTILHELVGHSMREMAASYPDEFAAVERLVGKPFAEWEVADHERVARMVERYFTSGLAPTPELVPTFDRMKRWGRAVTSEANRRVDVPIAVQHLLDTYFGSYDDANVFRVATLMTRIPQEHDVAYAQALFDYTAEELATLRRRNEKRAYNRSIEKLEKDVLALSQKVDRDLDEQAQLEAKFAQMHEMKAAQMVAEADRELHLRNRYKEIEDALANPTGDSYDSAVANVQALIAMREDILRSVFGDKYDTTFSNRVDLMADHLVQHGMIPPGFERGTAWFVPHRPTSGGRPARRIDRPAAALESQVVGKADISQLGLHSRNNLLRWQSGDLLADPIVAFEAWQNAQAFYMIHVLKQAMWDIGTPLDRLNPVVPDGVYVINHKGIPVPNVVKRQLPPASTTDVQRVMDALEGRDPEAIEASLVKYAGEVVMDESAARDLIATMGPDVGQLELKIVDKRIVDRLFRPLRGGGTAIGKTWDVANSIARWSLIYTNPAYIPFNFAANNIFLFAGGGPRAITAWVDAARYLHNDKAMRIRVGGQVGELPAHAAAQTGRGLHRFREAERKGLEAISYVPDRWPRMVAWVMEAKKMGYRSKEDMNRLLDGKTEATARAKQIVSQRATALMVDFDRLADWERQIATRVLFIWPWIRGATAWPFYYAREFPVATAAAANVGAKFEERRQRIMGNVRPGYRELVPLGEAKGQVARTINVGALSPTSTFAQLGDMLTENVRSLIHGEKLDAGDRLIDMVNPAWELVGRTAFGVSGFGQPQSYRDILFDSAANFVPFGAQIRQAIDPSQRTKVYDDRSMRGVLTRKLARIPVQSVDLVRLQAFREQEGAKTWQEKAQAQIDELAKDARSIGLTDPTPAGVVKGIRIQAAISEERERKKKEIEDSGKWRPRKQGDKPELSDLEEAETVLSVLRRFYPDVYRSFPEPAELPANLRESYADALRYGNEEDWGIPDPSAEARAYRSEVSAAKREKKLAGVGG